MARTWRRRCRAHPEGAGFALPLALLGGLVLLLSSLSVQTSALQSRLGDQRLTLRRLHEDALVSAGQLVAERLERHRCLLALPLQEWWGAAAALCSTAAEREAVLEGQLPGGDAASGRYRVVGYALVDGQDGSLQGGDLELEWRPAAGGSLRRRLRLALMAAPDPLAPPLLRGMRP